MVTCSVRSPVGSLYCRGSVALPPFNRLFRQSAAVSLPGLAESCIAGCGIFTALPSGPPLGYPFYPDPLSVVQEPLGFRCARFPRALSLLMPTFSFHAAPAHLPVNIHRRHQCSPTDPFGSHVFGAVLYARSSSTRHRSTSELLRTL